MGKKKLVFYVFFTLTIIAAFIISVYTMIYDFTLLTKVLLLISLSLLIIFNILNLFILNKKNQ
jgi:hypothetical protein